MAREKNTIDPGNTGSLDEGGRVTSGACSSCWLAGWGWWICVVRVGKEEGTGRGKGEPMPAERSRWHQSLFGQKQCK